jgi:hypothetical protein
MKVGRRESTDERGLTSTDRILRFCLRELLDHQTVAGAAYILNARSAQSPDGDSLIAPSTPTPPNRNKRTRLGAFPGRDHLAHAWN